MPPFRVNPVISVMLSAHGSVYEILVFEVSPLMKDLLCPKATRLKGPRGRRARRPPSRMDPGIASTSLLFPLYVART